ncbi:RIP metalloprotease RseP [soil metagenome]
MILEFLPYILWIVLALGILVFVHELGHFLAARLFGMRVDVFSIGFPPVVLKKQVGKTQYQVGAIPLGGYVKIAGMVDETMDDDFASQPPQPDEYRSKPVWQRMVVITAGVIFNIIFAILIYVGLAFTYGSSYTPAANVQAIYVAPESAAATAGLQTGDRILEVNGVPLERFEDLISPEAMMSDTYVLTVERDGSRTEVVDDGRTFFRTLNQADTREGPLAALGIDILPTLVGNVAADSPAQQAGLQWGDRITQLDGEPVALFADLAERVRAAEGAALTMRWMRPDSLRSESGTAREAGIYPGGHFLESTVVPEFDERLERHRIGIEPAYDLLTQEFGTAREELGFGESIVEGSSTAFRYTSFTFQMVGRLFTGRENLRESVGGPIIIARETRRAADRGMQQFWNFIALLSIALAVFNILPIPALDGGHLMFLLYEGITRREPSIKVRMVIQQVGFVVLLGFIAFVIFNDVTRIL